MTAVWRNVLWEKVWEIGTREKMRNKMKEGAGSAVILDGEMSNFVDI